MQMTQTPSPAAAAAIRTWRSDSLKLCQTRSHLPDRNTSTLTVANQRPSSTVHEPDVLIRPYVVTGGLTFSLFHPLFFTLPIRNRTADHYQNWEEGRRLP